MLTLRPVVTIVLTTLLALGLGTAPQSSWAIDAGGSKTLQPEEEDYTKNPYTQYGEFNQEDEEEADTRFFQHGRFFGVSVGMGFQEVSGNRGNLWQGGFPALEFKLHYWFDFNLALALGVMSAPHSFRAAPSVTGATGGSTFSYDVNVLAIGADIKYYFDVKNMSAPITFANPYVLVGGGSYSKTEQNLSDNSTEQMSAAGFRLGAGLEFALKPRKVYLNLEARVHFVHYRDTDDDRYSTQCNSTTGLTCYPDLSGMYYTFVGGLLFTW